VAVDIKIPALGESIHEGTIARWLKKDGDLVQRDEPVLELETDKATGEIPAPAEGVLRISAKEGNTVSVGATVGRVEEADAKKPDKSIEPGKAKPARSERAKEPIQKRSSELPMAPSVRELMRKHQLDAHQVTGTGRGGRITQQDVLDYLEERAQPRADANDEPAHDDDEIALPERDGRTPSEGAESPAAPTTAPEAGERRQRMSAIRQRIADRLVAAQRLTATLTTFNEADLSAVLDWRRQYRDAFREKHGVDLGLMPFFVKAAVEALQTFPIVNASIDGSDIVFHDAYNIGVAVSTERGLMVPVVRHADRLGFADIEKRIDELANKARAGKISVEDLQGGTFTITNGGVFGSLLSTPLLNPPQSAILGMHTIQKRPIALNDEVIIRPMMYLALSYDHRLIDGRDAVRFLLRVKECIENPERIFLES
jgi:2-oxoglutarate dehydrogenase E2 component (dihydrolipoamide succinyltransferase)